MVEAKIFRELALIELENIPKDLKNRSHYINLYISCLLKAIDEYEHSHPGEKPLKNKNRTKALFFSLSEQIELFKSLLPIIKTHEGRILISEIMSLKHQKRKELFE